MAGRGAADRIRKPVRVGHCIGTYMSWSHYGGLIGDRSCMCSALGLLQRASSIRSGNSKASPTDTDPQREAAQLQNDSMSPRLAYHTAWHSSKGEGVPVCISQTEGEGMNPMVTCVQVVDDRCPQQLCCTVVCEDETEASLSPHAIAKA